MFKSSEIVPIAMRMQSGINEFVDVIADRGFTPEEAKVIYEVFVESKVLKFDYNIGRVSVKHGAFLDKHVLDNALAASKEP